MTVDGATRALLAECLRAYGGSHRATHLLGGHLRGFDGPVRIAVTGPAGAGSSTLADALAGSRTLRDTTILDGGGSNGAAWTDGAAGAAWTDGAAGADPPADAVLQLIRNRRDPEPEAAPPQAAVGTIAVLCRSDELGAGRIDALTSGRRLARRYSRDPELRSRCQTVVAVAGLVAHAGRSLTDEEFAALDALSRCGRPELDGLLLSADRFVRADTLGPLEPGIRGHLLDRLGLFGVRLSTTLIRSGTNTHQLLAAELVRRSGLVELRESIRRYFVDRGAVLKARSALATIEVVLRAEPHPGAMRLAAELERVLAGAHEFRELRLLSAVDGDPRLLGERTAEARRLAGGAGIGVAERLGIDRPTGDAEIWHTTMDALRRWQEVADDPRGTADARRAARIVVRSCEGLLAAVRSG